MAVVNTLAYYILATITAVESFIKDAQDQQKQSLILKYVIC
jgi:hypothetical protein